MNKQKRTITIAHPMYNVGLVAIQPFSVEASSFEGAGEDSEAFREPAMSSSGNRFTRTFGGVTSTLKRLTTRSRASA
ncbi:hypothetical protein Ga0100231_017710 [Opitutaceae bacterium TAV4]|uniref:hypothetical protein n=1 Tax=Geminisphaera colitermitum TaxID=1148786 RepID=UPI0005BE95DD|nr:hypothetical protein [Geminisphaera colitermitum]RRJ95833.1 hypothetical protein Ga0100231_017710 [Opitutaceae bacterium TAV4]RRJ99170.1 hypothetical protein Ga0100230_013155 [Opitutaceae bacterium TAV3]